MRGKGVKKITAEKISKNLSRFSGLVVNLSTSQKKLLFDFLIKKVQVQSKREICLKLNLPLSPLPLLSVGGSQLKDWIREERGKNQNELIIDFTLSVQ